MVSPFRVEYGELILLFGCFVIDYRFLKLSSVYVIFLQEALSTAVGPALVPDHSFPEM